MVWLFSRSDSRKEAIEYFLNFAHCTCMRCGVDGKRRVTNSEGAVCCPECIDKTTEELSIFFGYDHLRVEGSFGREDENGVEVGGQVR